MKLTLRGSTDTTHPHPIIPIYVIHSIDHPFCPQPDCWCKNNQAQIAKTLLAIRVGALLLSEAVNLNTTGEEASPNEPTTIHEAASY
jgi:hypothetical protein